MLKTLVMVMAFAAPAATAAQFETQCDETTIAGAADTPLEHDCACVAASTCEEAETMIPVDQTTMHDPVRGTVGDCMRAAIASVLELPIDAVPDFTDGEVVDTADRLSSYWKAIDDFLDTRGMYAHRILGDWHMPSVHIAAGVSPRGTRHVVVREFLDVLHDPHPSRAGLAEVDSVYLLVPYDPARCAPPDKERA